MGRAQGVVTSLLVLVCIVTSFPHHAHAHPDDLPGPPAPMPTRPLDGVLAVTPSLLCERNATFTLTWSGVYPADLTDWIGVYCPPDSSDDQYVNFFDKRSVRTFPEGHGVIQFDLANMRLPYQFRYFGQNGTRVIISNNVTVCPWIPTQGHLSLTNDVSQMRIMWVSDQAPPVVPLVQWGSDPQHLTSMAKGTSHTYAASDMCSAPANISKPKHWRHPGWIHDALMTELTPGQVYYYRYGVDISTVVDQQHQLPVLGAVLRGEVSSSSKLPVHLSNEAAETRLEYSRYQEGVISRLAQSSWSEVFSFQAAPLTGPLVPARMMVYGDMGDGQKISDAMGTADRLSEHAERGDVDLVLHIGDISYARGVGWKWERFFEIIHQGATRLPYMVDIGNHEYDHLTPSASDPSGAPGNGWHPTWGNFLNDSHGECGRPTFERFHMPDNGNSLFWYSFDYGSAHIIHMSTEHDYTAGSPQYQWLAKDLASVNRQVTPWVVLAGHRPMYTSEDYPGDYNVSLGMQAAFEDLINQYQVDIAVWGHYHAYERTCAVYKQQCVTNGTVHIVVGTAGANIDKADWMPRVWSLHHANVLGYGLLSVSADAKDAATTLTWQFYANEDDDLLDSASYSKPLQQ